MTEIVPMLYLGGYPEATSHEWLQAHNIDIVINVAKELEHLVQEYPKNIKVKFLALDDSPDENIGKHLNMVTAYIADNHIHGRKNIFIHCYAGKSRSSTFVIYYLMKYYNYKYPDALKFVQSKRPIVDPNAGFKATLKSV
jgi:protein-tyrosine phosphatase